MAIIKKQFRNRLKNPSTFYTNEIKRNSDRIESNDVHRRFDDSKEMEKERKLTFKAFGLLIFCNHFRLGQMSEVRCKATSRRF